MKKFTSSSALALIVLFSCMLSLKTLGQAARLDQWQKGLAKWEYGNLNRRHSNYTEGESVPYRVFISGLTPNSQTTLLISFDITGTSHSPVKHGIDYLTSFSASFPDPPIGPFDDATARGDVPAQFSIPDGLDLKPIPAPTNLAARPSPADATHRRGSPA